MKVCQSILPVARNTNGVSTVPGGNTPVDRLQKGVCRKFFATIHQIVVLLTEELLYLLKHDYGLTFTFCYGVR